MTVLSLHYFIQSQAIEGVCEESQEKDAETPSHTQNLRYVHNLLSIHNNNHARSSARSTESFNTDTSSEWHISFVIPELRTFSQHVKDAVTSGIVPGRARREIVQVLRTYMTAHTIKPNSEQYNTVCKKLISKFPKLSDSKGKTKYVRIYVLIPANFTYFNHVQSSWKLSLRNSFKNFRRGFLKEKGIRDESAPPPPKRLKHCNDEPDISQEEYERAVKQLQGEQ